jgi:hypothetical protein
MTADTSNHDIAGDPMFRDTGTDPTKAAFYRIMQNSMAVDHANPMASFVAPIDHDIDHDPRPEDGGPDIGADEFRH